MRTLAVAAIALTVVAGLACRDDSASPDSVPRAVSTITLRPTVPGDSHRQTGSVESWKQEQIGFEVAARVEYIIEAGAEVQGRELAEDGTVLRRGDVLGRLNDSRYRQRVASARSRVDSAQAQAESLRVKIEEVLPQTLAEARAQRDKRKKDLERARELVSEKAAAQSALDEALAAYRSAQAEVEGAEASITATRAEHNAQEAKVTQLEEELRTAQLDLEDTVLRAPFSGQVSRTHALPGAYVSPGSPVVTLVVMDPIKVTVRVAPELNRRIAHGSPALVYPPGGGQPIDAFVYLKGPVADPATRTFDIDLLVRNRRVHVGGPPQAAPLQLPRVRELRSFEKKEPGRPGPWYVEARAVRHDERGAFVWIPEGREIRDRTDLPSTTTVRKAHLSLGEGRVSILRLFVYREVADMGEATPDALYVLHPPDGLEDGDTVALAHERWQLLPGDIVEAAFLAIQPPRGLYAPMASILEDAGRHYVLAVDDRNIARRIDVTLGRSVNDLYALESDALSSGTRIILKGAAYAVPGEEVRVVADDEVLP